MHTVAVAATDQSNVIFAASEGIVAVPKGATRKKQISGLTYV